MVMHHDNLMFSFEKIDPSLTKYQIDDDLFQIRLTSTSPSRVGTLMAMSATSAFMSSEASERASPFELAEPCEFYKQQILVISFLSSNMSHFCQFSKYI